MDFQGAGKSFVDLTLELISYVFPDAFVYLCISGSCV